MVNQRYEAINRYYADYERFLDADQGKLFSTAQENPSWIIHVVDEMFPLSQMPIEERAKALKGIKTLQLQVLNDRIMEFSKPDSKNRTENAKRAGEVGKAIQEVLNRNIGKEKI